MQMPIRSLQSMLRLLQRHAGKPTTVVPDGIFGRRRPVPWGISTAERPARHRGGRPYDWNAVVDAAREAHTHHGPAEPLRPLFSQRKPSPPASRTCTCTLRRGMLLALRHYYDGMPPVSVTGGTMKPAPPASNGCRPAAACP